MDPLLLVPSSYIVQHLQKLHQPAVHPLRAQILTFLAARPIMQKVGNAFASVMPFRKDVRPASEPPSPTELKQWALTIRDLVGDAPAGCALSVETLVKEGLVPTWEDAKLLGVTLQTVLGEDSYSPEYYERINAPVALKYWGPPAIKDLCTTMGFNKKSYTEDLAHLLYPSDLAALGVNLGEWLGGEANRASREMLCNTMEVDNLFSAASPKEWAQVGVTRSLLRELGLGETAMALSRRLKWDPKKTQAVFFQTSK